MNLGGLNTRSDCDLILDQLTEEQREVCLHNEGTYFVAAGPGSGKTRTLTHNVAFLINGGVKPSNILAITFTKKAALEMKERLDKLVGSMYSSQLNCGTIHSIYLKILRKEYEVLRHPLYPFEIIDGSRLRITRIIDDAKKNLTKRGIKITEIESSIVARSIGLFKANGLFPSEVELDEQSSDEEETIQLLYEEYERIKAERRLIDFDDMLLLTLKLFRDHPRVAKKWSDQFRYIFVDEFQDTNLCQAEVLKILMKSHKNLKCIGDPRQAIYGFRGGTPEIFENYASEFPGAKLMMLSKNFRCPQNICNQSNDFIRGKMNPLGLEAKSDKPEVSIRILSTSMDPYEEAGNVVQELSEQLEVEEIDPKDVYILYRTNAQSAPLEEVLTAAEIPYRIVGGGCFFDRKEVKDMVSYLNLAIGDDHSSIERVYNRPNRFLGKVWLSQFNSSFSNSGDLIASLGTCSSGRYARGVRALTGVILGMRSRGKDVNPGELIKFIREHTGYDEWHLQGYESQEDESALEHLRQLGVIASRFKSIKSFLDYVDMISRTYKLNEDQKDVVSLMTVHKCKGLENNVIFVVGLAEGLFPHYLAHEDEERRLAYVAFTRTMDRLIISPVILKSGISKFITEFIPDFVEEREGGNGRADAGEDADCESGNESDHSSLLEVQK